jgi:hypothetical protein
MAPEPISMVYFINPSHQSVCMCTAPTVTRQLLRRHVSVATNTRNSRRTAGGVISKESEGLYVDPPIVARQRLGRHVLRQQRSVGGIIFYVVHVISILSLTNARTVP